MFKINYVKSMYEGVIYDQTITMDLEKFEKLQDNISAEITMDFPRIRDYSFDDKCNAQTYLKRMFILRDGFVYLKNTQLRFISMFLKDNGICLDRNTRLKIVMEGRGITEKQIRKAIKKVYVDKTDLKVEFTVGDANFCITALKLNNMDIVVYGFDYNAMQDLHNVWTDSSDEEKQENLDNFVNTVRGCFEEDGFSFRDIEEINYFAINVTQDKINDIDRSSYKDDDFDFEDEFDKEEDK